MDTNHKTALLLSYHNWRTKREGGFHKLAEGLCRHGYDVDFVSVDRPVYGILKWRDERRNAAALWRLLRGVKATCHEQTVFNFGCPSLAVPPRLKRYLPGWLSRPLDLCCIPPLLNRIVGRRKNYQFILVESCQAVRFWEAIVRRFPDTRIFYRPSDPLCHGTATGLNQNAERKLLQKSDAVFLTNEESREMYRDAYPEVDVDSDRFVVLPNGIDVQHYQSAAASPFANVSNPVVCYVGAVKVCWDAIIQCAKALPDAQFVVVGPNLHPDKAAAKVVAQLSNLSFVDGVMPERVPEYVVNCDLFFVPYAAGSHLKTVRLQAKLLKAMAARKPVVALHMSKELEQYGIPVAETPLQFVSLVTDALGTGPIHYEIDFSQYNWTAIQDEFSALVC